jgi:hypothetical protein
MIGNVSLEEDQRRYYRPNYSADDPHQALTNEPLLRAQRCLWKRHLYKTPAGIAVSMRANQVIVWKNSDDQVWCISTWHDTVCFPVRPRAIISYVNLLPAKGSGAATLSASDLELVSIANSPAISRLVALLKENSLAQVSFAEDYDT